MTGKKILPPTYLLVAILMMIAFHWLVPLSQIVPGLCRPHSAGRWDQSQHRG